MNTTQNQPHQTSNTQRTENKTTDMVIHQHSRKLLKMDILMSETCWACNKWNKIASDIKLVFHSSSWMFVWSFFSLWHHFLNAPSLYNLSIPLSVGGRACWGKQFTIKKSYNANFIWCQVSNVVALSHRFIPWNLTDWLMNHLLHVSPTLSAVAIQKSKVLD